MSDAQIANAKHLEMLDGAICHFMGSGIMLIRSTDDEGCPQAAAVPEEVAAGIVAAYETEAGDGTVGPWSYRFMGNGVVMLGNRGEQDSEAVVTVENLRDALAELAN
jgi:hypothetical protein